MQVGTKICSLQGLEIKTEIKNGRATVELSLPVLSEKDMDGFLIYLWDAQGELAFYALHPAGEEDPCIIRLLRPHLWEGGEKPYLYRLEIYGAGGVQDAQETQEMCGACGMERGARRKLLARLPFPIRELTLASGKGSLLNGCTFLPKLVYYKDVRAFGGSGGEAFWERLERRLLWLTGMGANILRLGEAAGMSSEEYLKLQDYCDRAGLLLSAGEDCFGNCDLEGCAFGKDCVSGEFLFSAEGCPSAAYYLQRARWSSAPFVYIHAGSLQRQSDGLYRVTVYSNQQRVALFVNDAVFGFQSDGPEFVFQDIPARHFPLLLAAEAGGSSMSVTCYR